MRNWFGTTPEPEAPSVQITAAPFLCSNLGPGGLGWTHLKEDAQHRVNAAKFMKPGLRPVGAKVKLNPGTPGLKWRPANR